MDPQNWHNLDHQDPFDKILLWASQLDFLLQKVYQNSHIFCCCKMEI